MTVYISVTNINSLLLRISHRENDEREVTIKRHCNILDSEIVVYTCMLCEKLMQSPVQLMPCCHWGCFHCLKQFNSYRIPQCPKCSSKLQQNSLEFSVDKRLEKRIQNTACSCINFDDGCQVVVQINTLEEHAQVCKFSLEYCQWSCLSPVYMRKDLKKHEDECPRRLIRCPICYEEYPFEELQAHADRCLTQPINCELCRALITRSQMQTHIDFNCLKKLVYCPYFKFGCTEQIPRDLLDDHEMRCLSKHLRFVMEKCTKLEEHHKSLSRPSSRNHSGKLNSDENWPSWENVSAEHTLLTRQDGNVQLQKLRKEVHELKEWRVKNQGFMQEIIIGNNSHVKKEVENVEVKLKSMVDALSCRVTDIEKKGIGSMSLVRGNLSKSELEQKEIRENIEDVRQKLRYQNSLMQQMDKKIESSQEVDLSKVNLTSNSEKIGCIFWTVECTEADITTITREGNISLASDQFYSYNKGYKLVINADFIGEPINNEDYVDTTLYTKMILSIKLVVGEFDFALNWPYSGSLNVRIMDKNSVTCLMQQSGDFTDINHNTNSQLFQCTLNVKINLLKDQSLVVICQIDSFKNQLPSQEWFTMINHAFIKTLDKDLAENKAAYSGAYVTGDVNVVNADGVINGPHERLMRENNLANDSAIYDRTHVTCDQDVVNTDGAKYGVPENHMKENEFDFNIDESGFRNSHDGASSSENNNFLNMFNYLQVELDAFKNMREKVNKLESQQNQADTSKVTTNLRHKCNQLGKQCTELKQANIYLQTQIDSLKAELLQMKKQQESNYVNSNNNNASDEETNSPEKLDNINVKYLDLETHHSSASLPNVGSRDVRLKKSDSITETIDAASTFCKPGEKIKRVSNKVKTAHHFNSASLEQHTKKLGSDSDYIISAARTLSWVNDNSKSGSDSQINLH